MFDLLTLMAHKQSYVTVTLKTRHYSSDIAVYGDSSQHMQDHDTTHWSYCQWNMV